MVGEEISGWPERTGNGNGEASEAGRVETEDAVGARLVARLARLRAEHDWSLEELAHRSGVSRSALSRIERGETSPTAAVLGRLCTAYARTMSQLLAEVEAEPPQLLDAARQSVWTDPAAGFERRSVSPPRPGLRGELVEGTLRSGADIPYQAPAVAGMEQHIWLLEGELEVTVGETVHRLCAGDCLRFRLWGRSRFRNPGAAAARYALVVVLP